MLESGTLAGRVCVLAGGSGGIGAVLARQLHAEGAPLVLGYRHARERAETFAAELRASGSAPVVTIGGDLVREEVREQLLEAALTRSVSRMAWSCSPAIRRGLPPAWRLRRR